jgi:hypothetical protein
VEAPFFSLAQLQSDPAGRMGRLSPQPSIASFGMIEPFSNPISGGPKNGIQDSRRLRGPDPAGQAQAHHAGRNNVILAKLEGNNPAGSVKDRPACP